MGKGVPDICANRHGGADTSEIANRMATNEGRSRQRNEILVCIKKSGAGGMTSEEIEVRLSKPHQSVSARISELATMGAITSIARRLTSRGRPARVYFVR